VDLVGSGFGCWLVNHDNNVLSGPEVLYVEYCIPVQSPTNVESRSLIVKNDCVVNSKQHFSCFCFSVSWGLMYYKLVSVLYLEVYCLSQVKR